MLEWDINKRPSLADIISTVETVLFEQDAPAASDAAGVEEKAAADAGKGQAPEARLVQEQKVIVFRDYY